ncbi:MAG: hypothetical protein ACF8GE_06160 [Phycisphaerales bacterium JB043]
MKRTGLIASIVVGVCIIALLNSAPVIAQVAAGIEEDHTLANSHAAKMVGQWRGSGWGLGPDGRSEFEVIERARWHLSGQSIIVQGLGTSIDPETGEIEIGHNALAIIESDQETGQVKFLAYREGQGFTESTLEFDEETGEMTWGFQPNEHATIRFTITIENNIWREVGHFSQDGGESWMQFLEMTLDRVE